MPKTIIILILPLLLVSCQKTVLENQSANYTYISGRSLANQKVYYSNVNGYGVMEGDIVLGKVENLEKSKQSHFNEKVLKLEKENLIKNFIKLRLVLIKI